MNNTKPIFGLFIAFALAGTSLQAQSDMNKDSTGLPGDNFSLQGALAMFKKAGSPEEFEKLLNTESNNVNNLDLNGDGEIDYIKVIDQKDGDVHAFVLQDAVSETENQDIAVIEIEKTGDKNAVLQIVGDEDIYGEETIVEPTDDAEGVSYLNTGARYAHGPAADYNMEGSGLVVNVWFWPSVRYIYAPAYVTWRSPWSWRSRPVWWHPWRPVRYSVFYPRRSFYNPHYVVVRTNRVVRAHNVYRPVRVSSVTVRTNNHVTVNNYRSRTVNVSNGNGRVTRRTTTVQGNNGRKVRHTNTRVRRRG